MKVFRQYIHRLLRTAITLPQSGHAAYSHGFSIDRSTSLAYAISRGVIVAPWAMRLWPGQQPRHLHYTANGDEKAKNMHRTAEKHHLNCLERWLEPCIKEMRDTARAYGYALAVHGSLGFDIDIICVPWVKEADSPESLVSALREACGRVTHLPTYLGRFTLPTTWELENEENKECPVFSDKPHNRQSWAILLGGGVYVDVSVMLRSQDSK